MNAIIDGEPLTTQVTIRSILPAPELPFDVLENIVKLYLKNCSAGSQDSLTRSPRDLLRICHVSRSWRSSVLCMPSIWNAYVFTLRTIVLRNPSPNTPLYLHANDSKFIAWWEVHLPNTAPSFHISEPLTHIEKTPDDVESLGYTDAYITLFRGRAFRSARSLRLDLSDNDLQNICSDPTPFPKLVYMNIKHCHNNSARNWANWMTFPPAPFLTHLRLTDYEASSGWNHVFNLFPRDQITHLCIPTLFSPVTCMLYLTPCTNLKFAAVRLSAGPSSPTGTPLTMHCLQQLVVIPHRTPSHTCFSGFSFPNLSALRIIGWNSEMPMRDISDINSILSSTPTLKELHLDLLFSFETPTTQFDLEESGQSAALSILVPHLDRFVIELRLIRSTQYDAFTIILQFLRSEWLCRGWQLQDANGEPIVRKLDLIVKHCYFDMGMFVKRIWPTDSPFEISVSYRRDGVRFFNKPAPKFGWEDAIDFHGKLV